MRFIKDQINIKDKEIIQTQKGITLIALAITIIVLLILAGVTIGAITGEDGIIKNALEAREKTEIANEKEIVEEAVLNAMKNNKRGNIVRDELQEELDKITGEGKTIVTEDTEGQGYFVKFVSSQRIYKVSLDGDVTYLGEETELISQAEIIANPESNTTPQLLQQVELTVQTQIDIEGAEYSLVYAWNQDKDNAPEDSKFMETTLIGTGRIRKTTVSSVDTVGGEYYLWVRIVVGEIEKTQCFGPYAIRDHTTLIGTASENETTSGFLGSKTQEKETVKEVERRNIESINITTSLSGHSVSDENCWDVSESQNGLYLAWYEDKDNDGYYEVTIGGEGGVVANSDSNSLFNFIGNSVENQEVTITGLNNLETGLTTNMAYMFRQCKVSSLDVSSFNTENVTNMRYMFYNCSNLTSLDLNNFDTSKVTTLFSTFEGCSKLSTLKVSNWDTSNVVDMGEKAGYWGYGGTFQGCSSLTELDISKWDTSNVVGMGQMFSGCSSLTNLDVSNFNTSNVISMYNMFNGCQNLTKLDVSNFDTKNVIGISYMFSECHSLTELELSKFDITNVTSISYMFNGCNNLIELDLNNFNTSNITDMSYMFYSCYSLRNLNIKNFDTGNVTTMKYMFATCSSLTNLDLSNFDTKNVTNTEYMFAYCSGLTNLDVSDFDTSNVTSMRAMFRQCSKLTSLNLSNFNTDKVTDMWYMFYDDVSLKELDITNFNVENVTDWTSMFSNVPSTIQITTNQDMANWIKENFPSYTNITITN